MKDILVVNREYTKQDGTQGAEFVKVGVLGVSQNNKEYIILEPHINLAGLPRSEKGGVMCSVVDKSNNGQTNNNSNQGGYQQQNQPQQNYNQPNQQQQYNQPQQSYNPNQHQQ